MIKEKLIKILTPVNTKEIKPGLFIQEFNGRYRKITPAAWDNKLNWKVILLGDNWLKHLIWFLIIMLICASYYIETKDARDLVNRFNENPIKFCEGIDYFRSNYNDVGIKQDYPIGVSNIS